MAGGLSPGPPLQGRRRGCWLKGNSARGLWTHPPKPEATTTPRGCGADDSLSHLGCPLEALPAPDDRVWWSATLPSPGPHRPVRSGLPWTLGEEASVSKQQAMTPGGGEARTKAGGRAGRASSSPRSLGLPPKAPAAPAQAARRVHPAGLWPAPQLQGHRAQGAPAGTASRRASDHRQGETESAQARGPLRRPGPPGLAEHRLRAVCGSALGPPGLRAWARPFFLGHVLPPAAAPGSRHCGLGATTHCEGSRDLGGPAGDVAPLLSGDQVAVAKGSSVQTPPETHSRHMATHRHVAGQCGADRSPVQRCGFASQRGAEWPSQSAQRRSPSA